MKNFKVLGLAGLFLASSIEANGFVEKIGSLVKPCIPLGIAVAAYYGAKTETAKNALEKLDISSDETQVTTKAIMTIEAYNLVATSFIAHKIPALAHLKGHSARILALFAGYKLWNSSWVADIVNKTKELCFGKNKYDPWEPFAKAKYRARHLGMLYTITSFVPTEFKIVNMVADVTSGIADKIANTVVGHNLVVL